MAELTTRCVESSEEFQALKADWERLSQSNPDCHVFQTFDWNFIWWKHLGEDYRLFIIVAAQGTETIAIWPLMYSHKGTGPLRWRKFEFIGKRYSNYHDILLAQTADATETVHTLLMHLYREMSPRDYAVLRLLPKESVAATQLRILLEQRPLPHFWASDETFYLAELRGDWESYLQTVVPRKFRRDCERQIRRLLERGSLEFSACEDEESVQTSLTELFRMKILQRKEAGEVSFFEDQEFQDFEREIASTLLGRGWLFAHVLRFDDQIIAANLDLVFSSRVYCHIIAYDIKFDRRFSPGRILQYYEIEKSFARGSSEFDFAWDQAVYKDQWCNSQRQTSRLYLFKGSMQLQKFYLQHLRPRLKGIYLKLSPAGRGNLKRILRLDP